MPSENAVFASADLEKLMLDQVKQTSLLDIRGVCRSFPKGSGEDLQVLEKVRNRKLGPPVLILSARGGLDDRVKGLEQGADDFLVKPFAFVELLARVRALLRRGQPTPEKLQVADLALHDAARAQPAAGARHRGGRAGCATSTAGSMSSRQAT